MNHFLTGAVLELEGDYSIRKYLRLERGKERGREWCCDSRELPCQRGWHWSWSWSKEGLMETAERVGAPRGRAQEGVCVIEGIRCLCVWKVNQKT